MPRSSRFLPLLAVVAALALPAAPASAQDVVCAHCDSTQRSALVRSLRSELSLVRAELERLLPELERLTSDLAAGEPMNAARVALVVRENELRGIEQQLERALARLDLQRRRVATARAAVPRVAPHPTPRAPQVNVRVQTPDAQRRARPAGAAGGTPGASAGYIGVSFSGAVERSSGARRFYFHDYPQVVAVDAGSPAERGGLQAGDVLVALGGTELKGRPVDLNVVLRPGAKVPVRFRRDGTLRSATLVVARSPSGSRADPAAPVLMPLRDGALFPPEPPDAVEPALAAAPAAAPLPPIFGGGGMTGGVAGAEVARVQGNLREVLGVDGGLLVLDVGMGSPAARAGLHAGDVIQRADGELLRTPMDLINAVRQAPGPSVQLEIVRKKERRSVTLRW